MSRARTAIALVVLLALGALITGLAAAQSDPVQACVERNGARYVNPDRAVDAQYADVQTSCQAAVQGGFTPDASADDTPSGGGAAGSGGGGGTSAPAASSGSSAPAADDPVAEAARPARRRARPAATPQAQAAPQIASAAVMVAGASAGDAGGSPLPAAGALPGWLIGLLAAGGLALIGAAAVAARRRAR